MLPFFGACIWDYNTIHISSGSSNKPHGPADQITLDYNASIWGTKLPDKRAHNPRNVDIWFNAPFVKRVRYQKPTKELAYDYNAARWGTRKKEDF